MLGYAILLFLVVVIGTVAMYLGMGKAADSDVQRVKDRLLGRSKAEKTRDASGAEAPSLIKSDEPATGLASKILTNVRMAERVETMLERAGLRWTPSRLMQTALFGALAGFSLAWYMLPPPFDRFAWVTGLLGFIAPFCASSAKGKARMKKFEEQFPDSLEFVAALDARRPRFLGFARDDPPRIQRAAGRRSSAAPSTSRTWGCRSRTRCKIWPTRAAARSALLRLRRPAAEADGRQPCRAARQAGDPDPGAVQTARQDQGHQRARQNHGDHACRSFRWGWRS